MFLGNIPVAHTRDGEVLESRTASLRFEPLSSKLTSKRVRHTATLLADGTVLITGGFGSNRFAAPALRTAEIYDPSTDTFTALTASMQSVRTSHAAARLPDGRVLLTGGQTNNNGDGTDTAEIYDPATRTFTSVSSRMISPRGGHSSVLLSNGTVLVMGGYNNECVPLDTAEIFNPATQNFTALTSRMAQGREGADATVLEDGMVLVTGGGSSDNAFDTAEAFDPVTQTFTTLSATMTVPREGHAASRLADGSVLVSGGGTAGSDPPSTLVVRGTAELYDPSTQRFVAIPDRMTTARFFHRQTTLSDGSVLLTGGGKLKAYGSFLVLNTAERYVP